VDLLGDRHLRLQHKVKDGIALEGESRDAALRHIRNLWGYDVSLAAMDAETGAMLSERSTKEL